MAGACDAGKQHDQRYYGHTITVRGLNVGVDRPMPADGVIQISFDRYLLPSTVIRQSLVITDANKQALPVEDAPTLT